ncbi:hypothetical protein [Kribbella sp. NBC_00889]|uniref:hypothetical protein n=1 Tax=Kribbella sp. NBC_00889 TaxID=2975974 RepID=UPI00386B4642|nr:hypothetical protein OG817_01105 [Kribbella sp. NBC_00889]
MSGPEYVGSGDPLDAAGQMSFARFGACGSRIATQPDISLPLRLTASLPTAPLRATDNPPFIKIDMSVQNLSGSAVQVLTARYGARMAITKDGIVVAGPVGARPAGSRYTIDPGVAHEYESTVNLVGCDSDSGLAPGHYQLHALQRFTFLDKDWNLGPAILVAGGPWDVEID